MEGPADDEIILKYIITEATKVKSGRFHFPDDTTLVLISDEDQSELILRRDGPGTAVREAAWGQIKAKWP